MTWSPHLARFLLLILARCPFGTNSLTLYLINPKSTSFGISSTVCLFFLSSSCHFSIFALNSFQLIPSYWHQGELLLSPLSPKGTGSRGVKGPLTMSEWRLNHLLFLHIHKNLTNGLDLLKVLRNFRFLWRGWSKEPKCRTEETPYQTRKQGFIAGQVRCGTSRWQAKQHGESQGLSRAGRQ